MLRKMFKSFAGGGAVVAAPPLPEADEKLALGTLMVRVAKSDHRYVLAEIQQIDKILSLINDCGPIEAAKIRATCEKLEHEAPNTEEFGKIIRAAVSHGMRVQALAALWEVVLADGLRQDVELQEIEAARRAMGLSEKDNETARRMVAG